MKRCICLLLSIIISISVMIYNIGAWAAESICTVNISLDENFADDRIIVVFNNRASLSFKEYSTHDFEKIKIKSIKNLSESSGEKVKTAMLNVAEHVTSNVPLVPYEGIPLSNYKQILCLELSTPGKTNVITAIKELQKRDDVLLAAPDYELVECGLEPTDPHYQSKMNSWAEYIGLEDAWDEASIFVNEETIDAVRVGIIDSGIDGDHPDISGNLNTQLSENFTQNTWDLDYDGGIVDELGHGTMCASVVGAVANNDEGAAGVCWNVELVSLKVHDGLRFLSSYVAEAIDSADRKGIKILSMSLGWNVPHNGSLYYYDTVLDSCISNYSGLFVCAAGNDSRDIENDDFDELPASYPNLSNKIVVGSSNYDRISEFSNTGEETVDLFAQGENIYVAYPTSKCNSSNHFDPDFPQELYAHEDDGYHKASGTSFSAPLVAGVAAIMLCIDPYYLPYHPEEIKRKIRASVVDPDGNFEGECISGGRLNAYAAIRSVFHEPDDSGNCQHNYGSYYVSNGSSTHTVKCIFCDTIVVTQESHTIAYTLSNTINHTVHCTKCSYSFTENHERYVESVYDDGCTIACGSCSYSFDCDCTPNYRKFNSSVHWVDCPDGEFSFSEEHNFDYLWLLPNDSSRLFYHNAVCADCGGSYQLAHNWESAFGGGVECSDCGFESDFGGVGDVMSLSEEELELLLSSMSEEELGEFIAALPEDQLARVTAILPSEDEFLIE